MRRIVVMSDVHGNLTALKTVGQSLPDADEVVVAGDLCLDGPDPAGVVDFLREREWSVICGNTDRYILDPPKDAKPKEANTIAWTREQLGTERLRWLAELPFSRRVDGEGGERVLVVHANPFNLEDALHPGMSITELEPFLADLDAEILAFGHVHIPYVRPVGKTVLVDVSSVGIPKDRDPRAAFTVLEWNTTRRSIMQNRVPYDVQQVTHRMRTCGMPHAEKRVASLLKASY